MENFDFSGKIDLTNCDKEPIHIPGKIQSHGFMLICNMSNLNIVQLSKNTEKFIGINYQELLNQEIISILDKEIINSLRGWIEKKDFSSANPIKINIKNNTFNMMCSMSDNQLILEFEPIKEEQNIYSKFYYSLNSATTKIQNSATLNQLFQTTAEQIKDLIGYDRVMIYRFDEEWNGEVVAEALREGLEPYFGLHYPHTDIPSQARALYLKNWIMLITDVNLPQTEIYPVINPETNKPIDLSSTVLRATSPIHIEYLKNMGVCATMTISIIFNNKLWGLFSCHHYSPKFVDYHIRTTCEFIGKIFSSHLSFKSADEDIKYEQLVENNTDKLINQMSEDWDLFKGLTENDIKITDINDSTGAAIYYEKNMVMLGNTPDKRQIMEIIDWLKINTGDIYYSDSLSKDFKSAENFKEVCSGIIALSISKKLGEYVLWFKPEVLQTVQWGGNPDEKNVVVEASHIRLSPRKSFEKWSKEVKGKSLPWKKCEIKAVEKLRENIVNVVLENSAQLRILNKELEEQKKLLNLKNDELTNFAHIASHDLKEPLRTIMSYNQLLKLKYKNTLDKSANEYLDFAIDGSLRMSSLIDDLLQYAKVGLAKNQFEINDMNDIVSSAIKNLNLAIEEKSAIIEIEKLPSIIVEKNLMIQLFQNLISNSLKYSNKIPVKINISFKEREDDWLFCIRDNGIGIEEQYYESIFVMFKRLHPKSEYEGTGVGLSTCKKIVENHNGEIWVNSKIGEGSAFYFTVSKNLQEN